MDDGLGGLLDETHRNAVLGWLMTLLLAGLSIRYALEGSYRWFVFTGFAVALVLVPAVRFWDPLVMPPWELLVVVAVPVVDATILGQTFLTEIAVYVAVAAVALVVAIELHRFTPVRMNHSFAIGFVVLTTLAVAGGWNVAQWVSDATLGTTYIVGDRSQDEANHAMMIDFIYAAVAGLVAGIVFDRYFRMRSSEPAARTSVPQMGADGEVESESETPDQNPNQNQGQSQSQSRYRNQSQNQNAPPENQSNPTPSFVRERLNISESSIIWLSRAMQLALGGILVYGLLERDVTTISNAGIAFAITFLPAILERDRRLPLEPGLVFWLTSAVFLHAVGSAGLYGLVGPWDSLTHALSASIVAAGGYAVVRAIDLHSDEVYLPPKMMFGIILVFVLAFGVLWEIMEFAIDGITQEFGLEAVLAQHGIDDTIGDLVFDLVGAVIVATWGSVYLGDVSHRIADIIGK
ncbi:hypothetical protein OB955_08030 [Halobacteria archaeon AArc-m2/3/4]|uniref:DUF2238 domain-containing protein n=2 Tax=Natronoglomus mannanivorans TaxID=2979990 RepID=A0ABT2QCP3_9EURY|nr:hypothetical protein [Halobacteria archaeon AArc-m2/3/4]